MPNYGKYYIAVRLLLLKQSIACIALVLKDIIYRLPAPCNAQGLFLIQTLADFSGITSRQICMKDLLNDRFSSRCRIQHTIDSLKTAWRITDLKLSGFHPLLNTPLDVSRDGLAFFLRQQRKKTK